MKKLFSLLIALLLCVSVLSAYAEGAHEITWARAYESTSLDPAEAQDDESLNITAYTTEPLIRVMQGKIVPGVAESWEASEDELTYTFHLRQSTFSDGTPVTANDFAYAYFRLIDPNNGHAMADDGMFVKNAEAYVNGEATAEDVCYKVLDDYTIEITFKSSGLTNLYAVGSVSLAPLNQAFVEACGETYGTTAETVLGNGPMTIASWSHENRIELVKNEKYWNADAIQVTKLTGVCNVDGDTAAEMMMTGEINCASFSNPEQYEPLLDMGFTAFGYTGTYQFIHLNNAGSTPEAGRFLSNTNFRRAINAAIDRTALVNVVMKGQVPCYRLVDPDAEGVEGKFVDEYPLTEDEMFNVTAQPEKAQAYLAAALEELGATVEEVPVLSMLCFESQGNLTKMQAIQDMLKNTLGIECKIDPQPIQQMIGKVYTGDFDFWTGGLSIGTVDVADGILGSWDCTSVDALYGYENMEYAQLREKALTTTDLKERKDTIAELEKLFISEVPTIMVTWQTQQCILPEGVHVTNVHKSFGVDLAFLTFD